MESIPTDRDKRVRALTLRQIHDARRLHSGAPFTVDGHGVKNITTVAQVLIYEQNDSGMIMYTLVDGTDSLKARQFLRPPQEPPFQEIDFSTGAVQYIRVVGTIKDTYGHNGITVTQARRLDDPHELFYHLLDAMASTCYFKSGPPPSTSTSGEHDTPPDDVLDETPSVFVLPAAISSEMMLAPTSPMHVPWREGATVVEGVRPEDIVDSNAVARLASSEHTSPDRSHAGRNGPERLTDLQRTILREVRRGSGSGQGASAKSIATGINHLEASANVVAGALDFLVDNDFIFATTSDQFHYRLTVKGLASCFAG